MKHNDIVDVRNDKSPVYQATVADKKLLLLKCFDLYEAGKKEDQQRYFGLRAAILEIVYSIQEDTFHRGYEEGRGDMAEEIMQYVEVNKSPDSWGVNAVYADGFLSHLKTITSDKTDEV